MKTPNIDLLDIHDRYVDGKINLEQAIKETRVLLPLEDHKIEELLLSLERENVVQFPSREEEEEDKSCENIVFTLDSSNLFGTVTLEGEDDPDESA
tara:strand:+ start:1910 stop:2197 length:288 start_codon:yes stop_codon:yes gene_type:complete